MQAWASFYKMQSLCRQSPTVPRLKSFSIALSSPRSLSSFHTYLPNTHIHTHPEGRGHPELSASFTAKYSGLEAAKTTAVPPVFREVCFQDLTSLRASGTQKTGFGCEKAYFILEMNRLHLTSTLSPSVTGSKAWLRAPGTEGS